MGWTKGKPRGADDVPQGTSVEEIQRPVETKRETKGERKFSDENDHQGPQHPLCLGCNHREDMHHSWTSEQVLQDFRDATGKVSQRLVTIKHKVYDGPRPCQHACKCAEYR